MAWLHVRGMFVAGGTMLQWCHNCVSGLMATQLRIHGYGTSKRHGMTVVSHWCRCLLYVRYLEVQLYGDMKFKMSSRIKPI